MLGFYAERQVNSPTLLLTAFLFVADKGNKLINYQTRFYPLKSEKNLFFAFTESHSSNLPRPRFTTFLPPSKVCGYLMKVFFLHKKRGEVWKLTTHGFLEEDG